MDYSNTVPTPEPSKLPGLGQRLHHHLRAAGQVLLFQRVNWPSVPRPGVWDIALILLLVQMLMLLLFWLAREPDVPWVTAVDVLEGALTTLFLLGAIYWLTGAIRGGTMTGDEARPAVSTVFQGLNIAGLLLMLPLVLLGSLVFGLISAEFGLENLQFMYSMLMIGAAGLLALILIIWFLAAFYWALRRLPEASTGKALIAILPLVLTPAICTGLAMVDVDFGWEEVIASSDDDFETEESAGPRGEALTPEALQMQFELLDEALADLPAQRPGVVDVYVLTYAPYDTPVFVNESDTVIEVMQRRFDAGTRVVEMINAPELLTKRPWATPQNLKRAIKAVAAKMDPAEDVLFIHFTSHGGKDGTLSAELLPLQMPELTAPEVRQMLDDADIRWRVLSVSACYSGSWIPPLEDETTLVMTAADAEHTSYGCGWESDLTFFTRAVFAEQLSDKTRSFADAVNAAAPIIKRREVEAGKDDGFSNPQISIGAKIGPYLQQWEAQLNRSR